MTNRSEQMRRAYRESVAAGTPLTAPELTEQLGLSDGSLARRAIRAVQAEGNGTGSVATAVRTELSGEEMRSTDVPEPVQPIADYLREARNFQPDTETDSTFAEQRPAERTGAEPTFTVLDETHGSADVPSDPGRNLRRWTFAAVLLVALVAAVVSYAHQQALALAVGESWRSYLLPLSADGLIGAASWTLVARRRLGKPAKLATFALVLGVTASVAANVASAWHAGPAGWLVALWAPVALIVCIELLAQHVRRDKP